MSQMYRYPGPGGFQPQNPGMHPLLKTCLFVLLGLFTIGLVIGVVIVIFVVMFAGSSVDRATKGLAQGSGAQEDGTKRPNNGMGTGVNQNRPPQTPRLTIDQIPKPKTIADALTMLTQTESVYHEVAAEWLKGQPYDTQAAPKVSAALVAKFDWQTTPANTKLLAAIERWAHASTAADLATRLGRSRDFNAKILSILEKLKEPAAAASVVKLLESDTDAVLAKQTLQALGPQVIPFVAPYILSDSNLAQTHAKTLLEHFGIDPAEAVLEAVLSRLGDSDRLNDKEALQMLAEMDVIESQKERVVPLLVRAMNDDAPFWTDGVAYDAIRKWWSEEFLRPLQLAITDIGKVDPECYDLLAEFGDEETIRALTTALKNNRFNRDEITDCLVRFGNRATPEVLKISAGNDSDLSEHIEQFMAAVSVDSTVIVDRHLQSFRRGSETDVQAAFEYFSGRTPEDMGLTEEKHNEIAVAMAAGLKKTPWHKQDVARNVFYDWVTKDAAVGLVYLIEEDRTRANWEDDFAKLLEFDVPEISAPIVMDLLVDYSRKQKASQVMRRAGPPVQGVCIEALKTISDETAMAELVIILGMHGDATALEPLNELAKIATQRRFPAISNLCKESMRSIRGRTNAAAGEDGEGEAGTSPTDDDQ